MQAAHMRKNERMQLYDAACDEAADGAGVFTARLRLCAVLAAQPSQASRHNLVAPLADCPTVFADDESKIKPADTALELACVPQYL